VKTTLKESYRAFIPIYSTRLNYNIRDGVILCCCRIEQKLQVWIKDDGLAHTVQQFFMVNQINGSKFWWRVYVYLSFRTTLSISSWKEFPSLFLIQPLTVVSSANLTVGCLYHRVTFLHCLLVFPSSRLCLWKEFMNPTRLVVLSTWLSADCFDNRVQLGGFLSGKVLILN